MASDRDASPVFRMVQVSEATPPGGGEGAVLTVPQSSVGAVYRAADILERVEFNGGSFLRFGATGAFGGILFDLESGRVVEIGRGATEVGLVNTSLEKFSDCMKVFVEMFPLEGDDEEQDELAAQEIESAVLRIDSEAYFEGGFWYELRWSVAIGDFSEEDPV